MRYISNTVDTAICSKCDFVHPCSARTDWDEDSYSPKPVVSDRLEAFTASLNNDDAPADETVQSAVTPRLLSNYKYNFAYFWKTACAWPD